MIIGENPANECLPCRDDGGRGFKGILKPCGNRRGNNGPGGNVRLEFIELGG